MSAPVHNPASSPSAATLRRVVPAVAIVLLIAVVLMAACGNRRNSAQPAATAPITATSPHATTTTPPTPDRALAPTATLPTAASATAGAELTATAALTGGAPLSAAPAVTSAAPVTPTAGATAAIAAPACAIETSAELAGFSARDEELGCPTAEGGVEIVAINEFGAGPDYNRFMLWFANEQQIYVLQPNHSWLAYTDTWSEAEPELLCNPANLNPPTSPPLPRRGFGKLWCTVPAVQQVMGAIEREERQCQHAVVQRYEQGRLLACFEDATIRYFRLLEDGSWDMEMVQ